MQIENIDEAVERLYDLNVGVIGTGSARHERPHKPLLILAALDVIASGKATATQIVWSNNLRERFTSYFEKVHDRNDANTPDNPFLYLRSDGFWQPIEVVDDAERPLSHTPTVGEAESGRVFARFVGGFENFAGDRRGRNRLRDAIISRYFPTRRNELQPVFLESTSDVNAPAEALAPRVGDEEPSPFGRNPAFRRKVLEVYDFQCAACGLRIKLPDAEITFVDGAHLVPFKIGRNDHPTNGLALCKNHHWAMDRFLIVPSPEGAWKTSLRLDSRRSLGEQELCALNNRPILPPHDEAFRPDPESIRWRYERIYQE